MSTVLLAVHDVVGPALAVSPALEPPPASDKLLQLVRYLSWLALLLVPVFVIVVVLVLVRVLRNRSTEPGRPPHQAQAPSPPTPASAERRAAETAAPIPRPLRGGWHVVGDSPATGGSDAAPDPPLPGADGWPPPDPTVWGRPGQG